ncbi:MAG: GspE/PulE family protein, partial [Coleofasciculaceae cyanobacterium]
MALNQSDTDAPPIIALVNKILAKALQDDVSDIHIEPLEYALRIRFRKDGVLYQAFDLLPKKFSPAVVSRFKIMANIDISERRISQTGKIQRNFNGNSLDFQVSTLPSRYGEKVVLQLFDNGQIQLSLDDLIIDQKTILTVKRLAESSSGLILVTGTTDSRLTTLYSILAERNNVSVNIVTVEDPIKYTLPGITQILALQEKGCDFAPVLRSIMAQDPDIVLVSEIPDQETAKIAVEIASRGCLVLIGFQANDTADAIKGLAKMGIEPYKISNTLKGVITQSSMRRLCECRISYTPNKAEISRFNLSPSLTETATFYQAKTLNSEEIAEAKKQDTLCPQCHGIGYKGRIEAYEVLTISEHLQTLIIENASGEQVKAAAVAEEMTTLLTYSLNLVQQGYTTFEEVERLIFNDAILNTELQAKHENSLSPDVKVESQASDPWQRIQELEKQLATLISQFKQLKKELKN